MSSSGGGGSGGGGGGGGGTTQLEFNSAMTDFKVSARLRESRTGNIMPGISEPLRVKYAILIYVCCDWILKPYASTTGDVPRHGRRGDRGRAEGQQRRRRRHHREFSSHIICL